MVTGKAFQVSENQQHTHNWQIIEKDFRAIKAGELLIRVSYSSLNYKDCLSAHIHKGITRNYPHIPGIDVAGVIEESADSNFTRKEEVIVSGYDLGMNIDGGFADYVIVPAKWVVKKPESLSLRQAMIFGTAGFTAMLAITRLAKISNLDQGSILVTGATGGVGSLATLLLKEMGYHVTCLSRCHSDFLTKLSPDNIILTQDFTSDSSKSLLTREYSAAIDNLGNQVTNEILKRLDYGGAVALCGNVLGADLASSAYPFILRSVSLLGISSANCLMAERQKIWRKLAASKILAESEFIVKEISLEKLPDALMQMKSAQHQGRVIIKMC